MFLQHYARASTVVAWPNCRTSCVLVSRCATELGRLGEEGSGKGGEVGVHQWLGVLVLTAHRQPCAMVHQRGNERMGDGGEGRG